MLRQKNLHNQSSNSIKMLNEKLTFSYKINIMKHNISKMSNKKYITYKNVFNLHISYFSYLILKGNVIKVQGGM